MKKEILIIGENFYPEDFGINDLALKFQNNGYKVKVLTQNPSYPFDKIYDGYQNTLFSKSNFKGIEIYRVKTFLGRKKNFFLKTFSYIFFAIICCFYIFKVKGKTQNILVYQVGPLTQIIPALFSKLFQKTNIYIWVLDLWPHTVFAYGFKKRILSKLILDYFCKLSYRNCKKIFVSNTGFINEILKYNISKKNLIFCPQWIPESIKFSEGIIDVTLYEKDKLNFVFAGNIGMVQNLEIIIKAFSCFPKINLNIIGDGSNLDNLKVLKNRLNANNVFFLGRKPVSKIGKWLKAADILIISLIDKDTFNLTVPAKFQAYLGAEKPIFGIINGETSKLINDFKLGYTAVADNITDIKDKIKLFQLRFEESSLNTFTVNNKKIINKYYSFNNTYNLFEKNIFNKK